MGRNVEIRYLGPGPEPWGLYWSGTNEKASEERFESLEAAGPTARTLAGYDVQPEARAAGR